MAGSGVGVLVYRRRASISAAGKFSKKKKEMEQPTNWIQFDASGQYLLSLLWPPTPAGRGLVGSQSAMYVCAASNRWMKLVGLFFWGAVLALAGWLVVI